MTLGKDPQDSLATEKTAKLTIPFSFKAQGLVRPFRLLVHGTRYPTMTVQDRETPPITLEIHGAIVIVWIWPMGNVPD